MRRKERESPSLTLRSCTLSKRSNVSDFNSHSSTLYSTNDLFILGSIFYLLIDDQMNEEYMIPSNDASQTSTSNLKQHLILSLTCEFITNQSYLLRD